MRITRHWDAALPSATPGRVFTASIGTEQLTNDGAFLDHLQVGFKGDVDTAAVVIEAAVDSIALFTLKYGPQTRLQLDGNDLCALSALYYGRIPAIGENSDNTGTTLFGGVSIPVQQAASQENRFTLAADLLDQANFDTETICVDGYWFDQDYGRKPVHAVVTALTSAAATGRDLINQRITPVGRMVGLILAMPAASDFTDANIDISAQRVEIVKDGEVVGSLNTLASSLHAEEVNFVSLSIFGDLLARYKRFDFRPEGFDLKSGVFNIAIDNQDASDAIRVIPVIEME